MPQTKQEIIALLETVGMSPRHRFGQNFMIDQNLVRLVAAAGDVREADLIIEVGPGTGTLTEELLLRGASVVAVEIDRDLCSLLRERFAGRDKFELIEADALAGKHKLAAGILAAIDAGHRAGRPVKLVANLPYNIASPLIIEMLIAGVELLAFTVQREVAERLAAKAGGDAYGGLSVMVQLLAEVEVMRTFPPQAFWPPPRIESALVKLTRRDRLGARAGAFGTFIQQLFSARRKTLRNALTQAGVDVSLLPADLTVDLSARAEKLTPEELLELFEGIAPTIDNPSAARQQ
jgi:16S rRNA (adenine1518-N6/adenine1519-N6)-dimethyltransferase